MADRALRGMSLGAKSYEDEAGVDLADRQRIGFDCPQHHFEITFSIEADVPTSWECPRCGQLGLRSDGTEAETKPGKPPRTHWDMLRERRSVEDLEELLAERLELLRSSE